MFFAKIAAIPLQSSIYHDNWHCMCQACKERPFYCFHVAMIVMKVHCLSYYHECVVDVVEMIN